ncbi:MAG: hypothetical protein ABIP42_04035, partial [Planctomycetota bacterium]
MLLGPFLLAAFAIGVDARAGEPTARDVATALAQLAAPSAAERASAERELSRLLVAADAPLVAAAARGGSAEVRSRIASALMSDARHLALAASLAVSEDPGVARTGSDALAGQAAAWLQASDQEPAPRQVFEREFGGAFSGFWRLQMEHRDLDLQLDQIARLVERRRSDRPDSPPAALVLDPVFDAGNGPSAAELAEIGGSVFGNFADLVFAAAVTHQATFDIYGWSEGRTWIVVRGRNLEGRSAQSLLQSWIQTVERPRTSADARAAARALASSGWPAALEWLDARWRDLQDPAALDGLILAAGRGGLARSLASRKGAELLLERADRSLAASGEASRDARETARALLTIGTIGSEAWSEGFVAASMRARGLRCALVSATRNCPSELSSQLEARLMAADTPPQERFASLRALGSFARPRSGEVEVPGIEAAFEWAVGNGAGRWFPVALRAVGGREPSAWNTAFGLSPQARAVLCA